MLRAEIILGQYLDESTEGQTVTIVGQVTSLPKEQNKSVNFEFYIKEIISENGQSLPSPGKVRLGWYQQHETVIPGQFWHFKARLKRPYGFMNPGGFDYEAWLFQNRIRATGYVVNSSNDNYLLNESYFNVNRYRYFLRETLNNYLEYNPYRGLIIGLALGDRSQITQQHSELLYKTGTNHLLAISGLHIGIIAGIFYLMALRIYSITGIFQTYLAAPRFAALASILIAIIYAALAGFSIPTQRALIMLSVVMLIVFKQQNISYTSIFSVTLLVILLIDPFATISIGFWLSFCAVLIISYGMFNRIGINNIWWRWGRVQYLVALGLIPLLIFFFQKYPLTSLLANIFAVPWVSIFVLPFILTATIFSDLLPLISIFMFSIASQALEVLFYILGWFASLDVDLLQPANINIYTLLCSLAGVALLLLPRGIPGRFVGLIWMMPMFLPFKNRPDNQEFIFTLLDVGQGLSAVIQTHKHQLIYDTGAKFNENFNAGSSVIIPFLRNSKIGHVDLLIVSHGDNDHIGGARPLLREFPSTPVLTSVPGRFKPHEVMPCSAGQSWTWDEVRFEILHPDKTFRTKGNDNSCVLKISNKQHSILVSGDIEKQGEKKLLTNHKGKLKSTILIVPHHGSKSSSTTAFIDEISPEYAFFPVGYRNRYKFPNQDIIARYESRGINLFDTAQHGAIIVKSGVHDMTITTYRQKAQRFWHTNFN